MVDLQNLNKKVYTFLKNECRLIDDVQILNYITMRKEEIIKHHVTDVCRIYNPGEGGQDRYYFTKLTPSNRKNTHKVYGKTRKEVETKIIAYYLAIEDDKKITVQKVLDQAISGMNPDSAKRIQERFIKWWSPIATIPIGKLTEKQIRDGLQNLKQTGVKKKEFNNAITPLNKISDQVDYEHIQTQIDIRRVIAVYRKVKLTGKRDFINTAKRDETLVFSKTEAISILQYAIAHPSYKSLASAFLIVTGLRAGELLALETEDVDLAKRRIWIHQMEQTRTREIIQDCKDGSVRYVYLSDEAYLIARLVCNLRESDPTASPFLFLNPDNQTDEKMHIRALDDYFRVTVHKKILGLDSKTEARSAHDCRRTYASLEYLNGTDIRTIQKQMGHTTTAQTWDYVKDIVDINRVEQIKGCGLLENAVF